MLFLFKGIVSVGAGRQGNSVFTCLESPLHQVNHSDNQVNDTCELFDKQVTNAWESCVL